MDEFVNFHWPVDVGGYHWVETSPAGSTSPIGPEFMGVPEEDDVWEAEDSFLTSMLAVDIPRDCRYYEPLKESGLFRIFAQTDPTPAGIKDFADRFGLLGGRAQRVIRLPRPWDQLAAMRPNVSQHHLDDWKVRFPWSVGHGEDLASWREAIATMRFSLDLWSHIQRNDEVAVSAYIQWVGRNAVCLEYTGPSLGLDVPEQYRFAVIAESRASSNPYILKEFRPGDVMGPARYALLREVNAHLINNVTVRLLGESGFSTLHLHIYPSNLLSALWLQFARAIDGDKHYRRCEACTIWYELTPEVARLNRLYCSDACRSRAYRRRKIEAIQRHIAGTSVRQIAEDLGVDQQTVQEWITWAERRRPRGRPRKIALPE